MAEAQAEKREEVAAFPFFLDVKTEMQEELPTELLTERKMARAFHLLFFSMPLLRRLRLTPLVLLLFFPLASPEEDRQVRAQFEAYPYPPLGEGGAGGRDVLNSPSHLIEISHYLWGGRLDYCSRPIRILVAGGGTGGKTMQLARQLLDMGHPNAELVHLDLSSASLRIAEDEARKRGLLQKTTATAAADRGLNLRFVRSSILDAPDLGLGQFDYIDCLGVLNTLEVPWHGLAALKKMLRPGHGGMGIMVYGAYGRTGLYDLQELLRLVARALDKRRRVGAAPVSTARKIALAKTLLDQLPPSHRLRVDPWRYEALKSSLDQTGDVGVVDTLLPARDTAFTVPEVLAMVDAAELELASFVQPLAYRPETYLRKTAAQDSGDLLQTFHRARLGVREAAEAAELLAGTTMFHHFFYLRLPQMRGRGASSSSSSAWVSREAGGAAGSSSAAGEAKAEKGDQEGEEQLEEQGEKGGEGGGGGGGETFLPTRIASPRDVDLIPVPLFFHGMLLGRLLNGTRWLPWQIHQLELLVPLPALAAPIVALIDGTRTIRGIYDALTDQRNARFHVAGRSASSSGGGGGGASDGGNSDDAVWHEQWAAASKLSWKEFRTQFRALFSSLSGINKLYLSRRPVRIWSDHGASDDPKLYVANPRPPNHYHAPVSCSRKLLQPRSDGRPQKLEL